MISTPQKYISLLSARRQSEAVLHLQETGHVPATLQIIAMRSHGLMHMANGTSLSKAAASSTRQKVASLLSIARWYLLKANDNSYATGSRACYF